MDCDRQFQYLWLIMPRWNSLIKRSFTRRITRPAPLYTISPSATVINEGNTVVFAITTKNVADGTSLYWTNSGSTTAQDFTSAINSGSVTVSNNASTLGITTLDSDDPDEGNETIVIALRTGSTSGPIVANATAVIVNNVWSSMTVKILAVGGGGGGGAADNSYPGSGTSGGGAGAAYTTFTLVVAVPVTEVKAEIILIREALMVVVRVVLLVILAFRVLAEAEADGVVLIILVHTY